jgi:hypothetical protein
VWSDDVTEVALWSSADNGFTDFYEVRRVGDTYYFGAFRAHAANHLAGQADAGIAAAVHRNRGTVSRVAEYWPGGERPVEAPQRPKFTVPAASEPSIRILAPPVEGSEAGITAAARRRKLPGER